MNLAEMERRATLLERPLPPRIRRWLDLAREPGAPTAFWPSAMQGTQAPLVVSQATITAGGSAHTKGSYTQLTAGLAFPADGFYLALLPGTARTFLLDIAIGGAGSEVVILPNLGFSGHTTANSLVFDTFIPLRIPAGTRVAARCQATAAGATCQLNFNAVAGNFFSSFSAQRAVNYGANTGDSGGTTITPSSSSGVKGSYAQLSASIEAFTSMIVCTFVDDPANAYDDSSFKTDIAVGGAGSEVILAADLYSRSTTGSDCINPAIRWIPVSAKAGERLAARASSTVTTADRIHDTLVIGLS